MQEQLNDFGGLLRWPTLQKWVKENDLPGEGPITAVQHLTGSGSQNNIFRMERDDEVMVLRRPPEHLRANSNDIMVREARILSALATSNVPHPALYGSCNDVGVIGTAFNVMSYVEGFTPHGPLPGQYGSDPAWRKAMAFAIVDGAAELASIDPTDVGLGDFGKPEGWVQRQVGRWRSQFDGYLSLSGYSKPDLVGVDEIGAWLEARQPLEYRNGIIHGDYQFANVMFAIDEPRLAAVVDWELSTLGDPLLDLGWILTSWSETGDPAGHDVYVSPFDGFPSRSEVIERYLAISKRDPRLVDWYFVLACYKLGILVEGTWARALSGLAPMEAGERLHRAATWLFSKAHQLINS